MGVLAPVHRLCRLTPQGRVGPVTRIEAGEPVEVVTREMGRFGEDARASDGSRPCNDSSGPRVTNVPGIYS